MNATIEPSNSLQLENLYVPPDGTTIGEALTLQPAVQRLAGDRTPGALKSFSASFYFPLNLKTTLTSAAITGQQYPSLYQSGIFNIPNQQPFVFQLIPQVAISSSWVSTWQETSSYVDVADLAAENTAAAEPSSWTFSDSIIPVRKIYEIVRASEELYGDFPAFQTFVTERLTRAVLQRFDNEIINGDGTGNHLSGILNASITTISKGSLSRADALLTALSRVRSVGKSQGATGVVMHYTDALNLQTDKSTDTNYSASYPGSYSVSSPYSFDGVPVLRTDAIAQGTVLAGDFSGAKLHMRRELIIESETHDGSDWSLNRVALRASLRAALQVTVPGKFAAVSGF